MFPVLKHLIKKNLAQPYWNKAGNFIYLKQRVYFPKNSVIFRRAIFEGIYESELVQLLCRLIKPGTEILDIGANIGLIAIPLLRHNGSITVTSVEASPNSIPYLKKTNAESEYANRWQIIDKAVADKPGTISFELADPSYGAFDGIKNTQRTSMVKTVEVECTTIDIIWEQKQKPDVSLIKIDVEGADLLALRGGINCIKQCKPIIAMEWNQVNILPFNLSNIDLLDFCKSIQYELYAIPQMSKITSLNEMDLFTKLTENFLLIFDDQQ